jgi:hypothetical protein
MSCPKPRIVLQPAIAPNMPNNISAAKILRNMVYLLSGYLM